MIPCLLWLKHRSVTGLCLVAASLTGCGGKLVAGSSTEPVTLRLSFQPGQVAEYRTELHTLQAFGTGPTPAGLTSETITDVSHRTIGVEEDGGAAVEVDADPVSARTNGQETQVTLNPEPWRIVVAPQGAILESTRPISFDIGQEPGDAPTVQTNPTGAINPFPLLAAEPVRPGTRWGGEGRAPSPFGGGTVPFQVQGTMAGYELRGGVPAAVVESRVEVDLAVTVPAGEYLEGTGQTGFDLPPDSALEYDGELQYVLRSWLQVDGGQMLGSEVTGTFVTDVAWVGVPASRQGFDPVHAEGRLEATTERMR